MKWLVFFILFALFSCKRNHTSVSVNTVDIATGVPIANIEVEVIRQGKQGWRKDKNYLTVEKNHTNSFGRATIYFKYDRGNSYALYASASNDYYGTTADLSDDLKKGRNVATIRLTQLSYIKLNLHSINPDAKRLDVSIDDFGSFYYKNFLNHSNLLDTFVFCKVRSGPGLKNITWRVDSAGTRKNYSLPIQLKGHDTTYATINF